MDNQLTRVHRYTDRMLLVGIILLLVLTACSSRREEETQAATSTGAATITNIVWQWIEHTNRSTGETVTVPDLENYTITFREDGSFSGMADCNTIAGTYTATNGIQITLGPSTKAYCGEDSLDQLYLDTLGAVVAGGPAGEGKLALENAGGEQRMLFQDGGTAP